MLYLNDRIDDKNSKFLEKVYESKLEVRQMFVDVIKQDRKKYKEQGKLEGIKQGVQQGVNLVAKNMIKNGLDFQLISTVTGLNIQEIEKISKE